MSAQPTRPGFPTLALNYPLSLGTFDKYEDAQRAVDELSDRGFPVQNCLIVGTDLKQLERVTSRLTWGRVLLGGALSGVWLGLFVGLIFAMFETQSSPVALMLTPALAGTAFGVVWAALGYAMTRGRRDFASVSQVVATKYEVFVEHTFAQQGREILQAAGITTPSYAVPAPPAEPAAPSSATPPGAADAPASPTSPTN